MAKKNKRKSIKEKSIKKVKCEKIIWFPIEIIEYILSFIPANEHFNYKLVCKHWYQYFKHKITSIITGFPNKIVHFYPNLENITIKYDGDSYINFNLNNVVNLKKIVLYNFNFSKINFHINKNTNKKVILQVYSDYYNGNCLKPVFDQIIEHNFVDSFYINSKSSFCMHCKVLYSLLPVKELCLENCRAFDKDIIKNIILNENIEKLTINDVSFDNLPSRYYMKIMRMPILKDLYISRTLLTTSEIDYFAKYQADALINKQNPNNKEHFINIHFL